MLLFPKNCSPHIIFLLLHCIDHLLDVKGCSNEGSLSCQLLPRDGNSIFNAIPEGSVALISNTGAFLC